MDRDMSLMVDIRIEVQVEHIRGPSGWCPRHCRLSLFRVYEGPVSNSYLAVNNKKYLCCRGRQCPNTWRLDQQVKRK
jgi:hypothetical protein